MNTFKPFALMLAFLAAIVTMSAPSLGQSLPPPGASLTLEQYVGLQERTNAFCLYYNEAVKNGTPVPDADLALGNGYVYTAAELKALKTHCALLMQLMQQVVDANRKPVQAILP